MRRQARQSRPSAWVRIELADGVELHLAADQELPGPQAARELREAVSRILGSQTMHEPGAPGEGTKEDDDER